MEKITKTIEGKVVEFSNIEPAMVEGTGKLLDSNIERGVPLQTMVERMEKLGFKVNVGGEPTQTVVVEATEVGDNLFAPEPSEEAEKSKKPKPAKSPKKAKPAKKTSVKKGAKSKAVNGNRGRKANFEKQTKAFELIRKLQTDGKDVKDIMKAGMKAFKATYPAFYYYFRLYTAQKEK